MSAALRRPDPSLKCAPATTVARFTLLKLLILLLLLSGLLLIRVVLALDPPSLEAVPPAIIAGELRLGGQGTPGSTVELLANETLLGTTEVTADGSWQLAPTFPAGRYTLQAQAVDRDEQRLAAPQGQARLYVVDRPTLLLSSPRTHDNVAEVTLSGEGTPASRLNLIWNEQRATTLTVAADGHWQHTLPELPVPSENLFVAQVLDDAGNALAASAQRRLSLTAPEVTVAPLQVESVHFRRLRRGAGQQISGELEVSGRGEPATLITVSRAQGSSVPAVVVADDGTWSVTAPLALVPGDYPFRADMADTRERLLAQVTFKLVVISPPTLSAEGGQTDMDDVFLAGTARPDETLTLYADNEQLAAVVADGDGRWQYQTRLGAGTHQLFARANSGLDSDWQLLRVALARPAILGQSRDEEGQPLPGFFGTGRPHVQLAIIVAGETIGQATVDDNGRWACNCTLAPGEHTVSVREVAEPERSSAPLTLSVANPVPAFTPGIAEPGAPPFRCPDPSPPGVVEGSIYVIGCGESLSVIALRLGVTVDALLAHNPQLAHPPQVYFGQRLNIPAGAACSDTVANS